MTNETYLKKLTEGPLIERLQFLARDYKNFIGGSSCQIQSINKAKADLLQETIQVLQGIKYKP